MSNDEHPPHPVTGSSSNGEDPTLPQSMTPAPPSYSARDSPVPNDTQELPPREPPRTHARSSLSTTHPSPDDDLEACPIHDAPPDYQHTSASPPAYKNARESSYDYNPRSSNIHQLVAYDSTAELTPTSHGQLACKYRRYGGHDRRRRSGWIRPSRRWVITGVSLIACSMMIVIGVKVSRG